jgi:hypothetical protein
MISRDYHLPLVLETRILRRRLTRSGNGSLVQSEKGLRNPGQSPEDMSRPRLLPKAFVRLHAELVSQGQPWE